VSGDPARLQQVFWNLLSNSVKHSSRGGTVQLTLDQRASHVEIVVTDDGEGIPLDFLPHVFDRFRQADATTTRRHGGLGLGLSIVKQLVELHGGSVRAESEGIGRGATFVVTLPLLSWEAEKRPNAATGPSPCATSNVAAESVTLAGLNVLVVDDEPDARALVCRILHDRGALVMSAGSATEALSLFRQRGFDVLVSDIGMPSHDGCTLIRWLRGLPSEQGGLVPAIALTAYARPEDRTRVLLAGYQMHMTKPVEPDELAVTVATLTRR
jgi:CheY-like chemotaxis protein/anti-sigma regulatory factor (Ser/Thr protein kinase)